MRKIVVVALMLAMAGVASAQEAEDPDTEAEAIAMLTMRTERLGLSSEDAAAAGDALRAMVEAGIRVRNAYRIASDALDQGLKARELTMLAERVRQRRSLGVPTEDCEDTARAMVKEQVRTRERTLAGTATQTQERSGEASAAQSGKGK